MATVILFDVDSTLVTCGGAGRAAMEAAFEQLCGRRDVFTFPFGGATDRGITRRALENAGLSADEASIDGFIELYLSHLPPLLARSSKYAVLPGVNELLDALEPHAHLAVGLGTGNVERGARAKLERGGLSARFAFGGFGCDHEERARLLEAGARRGAARLGIARDKARVVIVGDTPKDVEAAKAIGAECIAVATGSHGGEALAACGAELVVEDLRAAAVLQALTRS
jgi:phosphoglycolate phosphatase